MTKPLGYITMICEPKNFKLPDKCVGFVLVWDTKKAAREYHGKNVELKEVKFAGFVPKEKEE